MSGKLTGASRLFLALSMVATFAGGTAMSQSVSPDWIDVSVGNLLTLRAPPGTVFQRQSGTDSFVGNLRGPGFVLHLDYGLFSPRPPDQAGLINQTVQELNLDDKPAKIVSGGVVASSPPKYFIGLYMADLRSPTASNPSSLAIYAELPTTDQDPLIRAIFTTIRFARR